MFALLQNEGHILCGQNFYAETVSQNDGVFACLRLGNAVLFTVPGLDHFAAAQGQAQR